CFSGDELRVYVRQESGSAVDITSAWLNVYLVDRVIPRSAGAPPVDVVSKGQEVVPAMGTYVVSLPMASPGDVIFAAIANSDVFSGWAISTPSGWTELHDVSSTEAHGKIIMRVADG